MNTDIAHTAPEQTAWVVFSGKTDLPWLRLLRPGFRHCFVLINDGTHWVSIDPLSHYTDVLVHHVPAEFDLPGWLEQRGHSVMKAPLRRNLKRPAPFGFLSCVGSAKRVLGIHERNILTPWQLYRYLHRQAFSLRHPGARVSACAPFHSGDFAWAA